MNERIHELYGNALDKAVPYTWHNLDHVEVEKIMKVFAELIVRECISKLDDIGVIDRDSRTIAMKVISEHFRVEE